MPRKTSLDSLQAELGSVSELLKQARAANDPIGTLQYQYRSDAIKSEIAALEGAHMPQASVALYFGGRPVLGSKGISAEFAGSVLEKFQDLVTRAYAKAEYGVLGRRGPIPLKSSTQLMVTEIARGSFGFVLDEMSEKDDLHGSALKFIVEEVDQIVQDTASSDETQFEAAVEQLDARMLTGLRDLFVALDVSDANMRIVDDKRDIVLDDAAVARGRARTEATVIDEEEQYLTGRLIGFLPQHKKFEMRPVDGELIYGTVSKEAAEQFEAHLHSGDDPLGKVWKLSMIVRKVVPFRRAARLTYHLVELLGSIESDA